MSGYGGMFTLLRTSGIMRKLYGELCMEESTFIVEGASKKSGFEVILGLYGKTLLKCTIPIFFIQLPRGKNDLERS